jgi:hypothetical protein
VVNRKCDRGKNDEKLGTAHWLVASTRRIGLSFYSSVGITAMKTAIGSLAAVVVLVLVAWSYAGDGYFVKCNSEKCGFDRLVVFGGGKRFEQLTGYCDHCQEFVSLAWTREDSAFSITDDQKKVRPTPIAKIWDSRTGNHLTLYPCPKCTKPFAEIQKQEDLKYCPKCNKAEPKKELGLAVD